MISTRDDIPNVRLNEVEQRLELEYPCRWVYKVIGTSETAVRGAVMQVIDVEGMTLELSQRSSKGSYVSFNVELTVESEHQRKSLYEALRAHDDVRIVL